MPLTSFPRTRPRLISALSFTKSVGPNGTTINAALDSFLENGPERLPSRRGVVGGLITPTRPVVGRYFRWRITCRVRSWLRHGLWRFIGRIAHRIVQRLGRRILSGRSRWIVQRLWRRLLRAIRISRHRNDPLICYPRTTRCRNYRSALATSGPERWSDDIAVPTFGPRMACARCGGRRCQQRRTGASTWRSVSSRVQ
jgi:hypothetical protein